MRKVEEESCDMGEDSGWEDGEGGEGVVNFFARTTENGNEKGRKGPDEQQ